MLGLFRRVKFNEGQFESCRLRISGTVYGYSRREGVGSEVWLCWGAGKHARAGRLLRPRVLVRGALLTRQLRGWVGGLRKPKAGNPHGGAPGGSALMPRIYQIAPPRSPLRSECYRLFGCKRVCAIVPLAGKFGLPVLRMVFLVLQGKRGSWAVRYSAFVGSGLKGKRVVNPAVRGYLNRDWPYGSGCCTTKSRAGNPHGGASVCTLREPPMGVSVPARSPLRQNPAATNLKHSRVHFARRWILALAGLDPSAQPNCLADSPTPCA